MTICVATLRNDLDTNKELYEQVVKNKQILLQSVKPEASADQVLAELNRYSHTFKGAKHFTPIHRTDTKTFSD